MADRKEQPRGNLPTADRPRHAWVGSAESWLGLAAHREKPGALNTVGHQGPVWVLCRAIVEAVPTRKPRLVAHT